MSDNIPPLDQQLETFYDQHPFYPKWPFGAITKLHQRRMDRDHDWYHTVIGLKEEYQYEPAPF
jgi:hypothetical protein